MGSLLRYLQPSEERDILSQKVQPFIGTICTYDSTTMISNYVSIPPDGRCGRYLLTFLCYVLAFPSNGVNAPLEHFQFSPSKQDTTSFQICLSFFGFVLNLTQKTFTMLQESDPLFVLTSVEGIKAFSSNPHTFPEILKALSVGLQQWTSRLDSGRNEAALYIPYDLLLAAHDTNVLANALKTYTAIILDNSKPAPEDTLSAQKLLYTWKNEGISHSCDPILLNKPPGASFVVVQNSPAGDSNSSCFQAFNEQTRKVLQADLDLQNGPQTAPEPVSNSSTIVGGDVSPSLFAARVPPSVTICISLFKDIPLEGSIIVLMTKEQQSLFRKYGNGAVYLDSTHSTNEYAFPLMSLVVEDVFGCGRVVATCIATSTSAAYVQAFLLAVQHACPDVKPAVFMTDDDNAVLF